MADLKSKPLIVLKGLLFLLIVLAAGGALWMQQPTWQTAALLLLLAWAAARYYYFLFYVLEKYVDPSLKYAGIPSLIIAIVNRRKAALPEEEQS